MRSRESALCLGEAAPPPSLDDELAGAWTPVAVVEPSQAEGWAGGAQFQGAATDKWHGCGTVCRAAAMCGARSRQVAACGEL